MPSLFPSGPTLLGQQMGALSSLAPPKATPDMLGPGPLGMSPGLMGTPQKIVNFTPFNQAQTATFDGTPQKLGPGDLFMPMPDAPASAVPGVQTPVAGSGNLGSVPGAPVLDQYNTAFAAAGAKYGIDPAWLKGIAAEEHGWGADSVSGAGAIGLMQIMPGGYSNLEALYPNWKTDATQNIMLGAAILNAKKQENGGDLNRGTKAYLGSGVDPYTGVSTDQYLNAVQNYANQIGMGSSGAGVGGGLSAAFGQFGSGPVLGEFNVANGAMCMGQPCYTYGSEYGLNGVNHTGLDIAMPYHTAYTAPLSGTVVCAGTNIGPGVDGTGCGAFSDTIGGGVGRVEIQIDANTVLIFGHSSGSAFQPGQHVNAGQVLGWSGGENSPHVHLEARVRDSSTASGWRIVDPRTILGGATGMGGGNPAVQPNMGSYASQIMNFLRGH